MSDEQEEQPQENIAKRGLKRMLSVFNVRGKEITDNQPEPEEDNSRHVFAGTFSPTEIVKLPGVEADAKHNTAIKEIEQHLTGTMENTRSKTAEARSYKLMTPEIGKARSVLIPSIMSPNDIQTGHIGISVDIPDVSEETNQRISVFLNDYYNEDLKLGDKVTEWIGDALFESGASPVLINPKCGLRLLSQTTDLEEAYAKAGKELQIGQEGMSEADIKASVDLGIPVVTEEEAKKKFDVCTGMESIEFDPSEIHSATESMYEPEFFKDVKESDFVPYADAITELDLYIQEAGLQHAGISAESMSKTVVGSVHDLINKNKEGFTFSKDYRSIIDPKTAVSRANKSVISNIQKSLYGSKSEKLFVMSHEDEVAEGDHPALLELPSESVIPVAVPGSKSNHIGYFIMVDEFGNPMGQEATEAATCNVSKGAIQSGAKTMFGSQFSTNMSDSQRFEASSLVFGITVRKMLEDKLNKNGVEGITLDQHQAISNTMFQRLLRKQKVKVIFVPSNLMAYYAFAYREDGTGKSLLEDASFLLSLRNTLTIANVMAGIKNSTDFKRIEFNVGDQATNLEQIMGMLQDMYINKKMLRFDHNPMTATRDLVQRSITMVPKGIKGLGDLEVTTDNVNGNSVEPSTEMLETLTSQIVTFLGVPHAVLNELGENEFSRSVATTNLFFSNEVRSKQKVVCSISEKLVRQYTQSSFSLTSKIIELIKESTDEKGVKEVESTQQLLIKIINNIKITLPTPSISVDKAHFEELKEGIDIMDSLIEKLFDDDLISAENPQAKDMFASVRATMKQKLLRDLISRMGVQNTIDIPNIEDIDFADILDINQIVLNLGKGVKMMEKTIAGGDDDDDEYR